jgi:endonuclease YncB( thermonuclease family)
MEEPLHGITDECEIVRVLDGDTVEVKITKTAMVRLLDCWAPEVKGESKVEGLKSKEHLELICKPGMKATVFLPYPGKGRIGDVISMGRVLGRLWIGGVDVSKYQTDTGMAKVEK